MAKKLRIIFTHYIELDEEDVKNIADYVDTDNNIDVVYKYIQNSPFPIELIDEATGIGPTYLDIESEVIDG